MEQGIAEPVQVHQETDEPVPAMPRIENWWITTRKTSGMYVADPDARCVSGNVYGHPFQRDGTEIWTTEIQWIDYSMRLCQTKSRLYALGKARAT